MEYKSIKFIYHKPLNNMFTPPSGEYHKNLTIMKLNHLIFQIIKFIVVFNNIINYQFIALLQ
jgi:hypothetical protein